MPYATRDDVYNLALSAQAFVVAPRPVGAPPSSLALDFNYTTGTIRLPGNGYGAGDIVYLLPTIGGSVPTGAAPLTPYYTIPGPVADFFQIAATPGGPVLTFSDLGAGWAVIVDTGRRIDMHLAERASVIDEHLTAHLPPIQPDPITGKIPQVLVGLNARMAARAAVTSLQIDNAQYRVAVDRLFAMAGQDGDTNPPAQKGSLLGDWKSGKPIQPRPYDENGVLPDNAAIFGSGRGGRGFNARVLR